MERFEFRLGKRLARGEKSRSGCYALISTNKGIALRISLMSGIAELHCDDDSRHLREAFLTRTK